MDITDVDCLENLLVLLNKSQEQTVEGFVDTLIDTIKGLHGEIILLDNEIQELNQRLLSFEKILAQLE